MRSSFIRTPWTAPCGQMLVVFALTLTVFLGAAVLGVDLAHLRAEVERAQHAAVAAALAGVVFMPTFQDQAFYRATEEATKNGFVTNAGAAIAVTPAAVPGHDYRLRVSISEPVPLFFGHVFGVGSRWISVSATAEFLPPLQMGAPDYVLGFPRFPSYLTDDGSSDASRTPQNFYLTQEGPYTYKEEGDAYSPYFESTNSPYNGYNPSYAGGVGTGPNPCVTNSPSPCMGTGVVANKAPGGGAAFGGYKYVISIPDSRTVLVKIFNPFSELNYNATASCWDQGYQGSTTPLRALYGQCNGTQTTAPASPLSGYDITPQDTAGHCLLGIQGGGCRTEAIEDNLLTSFGPPLNGYGYPDPSTLPGTLPETTLDYALTGPGQSLLDPALTTTPVTLTGSASTDKCAGATENCVIAAPFEGGNDPTACDTTVCNPSPVAFHFVNYAVLHGPGYFQLTVRSVGNTDGTYGESNHSYGIAVCDAASDPTYTGTTSPLGYQAGSTYQYASANPLSTTPTDNGWNPLACPSPNDPTRCPNPRVAAPGSCVQIYAQGAMPLYNYVAQGSSLIPLGYIPADYAGQTVNVDLYDPGDVQSSSTPPSSIFGCLVPTTSSSGWRRRTVWRCSRRPVTSSARARTTSTGTRTHRAPTHSR
ncbi:MAG: pilus assembly protein TadG-related protein [Chloroflexota bacterium]|nr:pilus assembly protein TadG-related protein [Chloroflexota bacterium]